MAKKSMDWALDRLSGMLTVDHKDSDGEVLKTMEFDLNQIFESWTEMTMVQKEIAAYGVKQKMADCCAANKDMGQTVNDRIVALSNMWGRLVDGIWTQKTGDKNTLAKKLESGIADGKIPVTPELLEALRKMGVKC